MLRIFGHTKFEARFLRLDREISPVNRRSARFLQIISYRIRSLRCSNSLDTAAPHFPGMNKNSFSVEVVECSHVGLKSVCRSIV